jgi:hypothetical protein
MIFFNLRDTQRVDYVCHRAQALRLHIAYASHQYFASAQIGDYVPVSTVSKHIKFIIDSVCKSKRLRDKNYIQKL